MLLCYKMPSLLCSCSEDSSWQTQIISVQGNLSTAGKGQAMHSCTTMLLFATVAMVTIHIVLGQMYHYSNGWNPGKRSMQEPVCHFRPEIKSLIFRLMEEEVYRMLSDASCLSGIQPLRNLLKKDIAYPLPLDDQK